MQDAALHDLMPKDHSFTDAELAKFIHGLFFEYHHRKLEESRRADADLAGTMASHQEWERSHDEDGVGWSSRNPYDVEGQRLRAMQASLLANKAYCAMEYVTEHFLGRIPDSPSQEPNLGGSQQP